MVNQLKDKEGGSAIKKKVFMAKMIFMALILSRCFGISCPAPAAPKKVAVQSIRVTGAGKVKGTWKSFQGDKISGSDSSGQNRPYVFVA